MAKAWLRFHFYSTFHHVAYLSLAYLETLFVLLHCYTATGTIKGEERDIAAVDQLKSTSTLLPVIVLSTANNEYLRSKIVGETEDIKSQFVGLVFKLQKSLEKANVPPHDVINILSCMEPNFLDVLNGCTTVAKIFSVMNKFWSFYDYILVKLIINNLGDAQTRDHLKSYVQNVKEYLQRRVSDCPLNAFGDGEDNHKDLVIVKIDDELASLDFHKMSKLRNEVIKHVGIKYVRLLSVDDGCVSLTFRIVLSQKDEQISKLTANQGQALCNLGVLSISYLGNEIFNYESAACEVLLLASDNKESNRINPGNYVFSIPYKLSYL